MGWVALMMEAAGMSETLVNFCLTKRRNIPENCHSRCEDYRTYRIEVCNPLITKH
jgi:hypothetical protein